MEETDKKIINLLLKDGRVKYREIAKKLSISTSTAFKKLNRLFREGYVLRVAPDLSEKATGLSYEAVIALLVESGHLEEVEKRIAHLENVNAVYDITGEWDALIIAKFRTKEKMNDFVKNLRKIPHVIRTNISFVLNKVKEDFVFKGFEVEK